MRGDGMTCCTGYEGGAPNVGAAERMASAIGGGKLALAGLRRALIRRSKFGLLLAVAGGYLAYRGYKGRCRVYQALGAAPNPGAMSNPFSREVAVHKSITINKPAPELYAFWRDLKNLPRIMRHVEGVEVLDGRRSRWTVEGPGGRLMHWEATIIEERENEYLAWSSSGGEGIEHAGSVTFEPARSGRGTVVRISMTYRPTGGAVSTAVAKLFHREPAQEIQGDLRRFKQLMETGEIATNLSPSAREVDRASMPASRFRRRRTERHRPEDWHAEIGGKREPVEIASEDSFPASDPPAWTGSHQ